MPKRIDWTPIEADVRIGKLSIEYIAKKHGVSYSGLRQKIKQCGWTPDLTQAVQAATRAELAQQARQRAAQPPNDGDLVVQASGAAVQVLNSAIDAAVAENVLVINRHRSMADALMRLVGKLTEEVSAITDEDNSAADKLDTLGDRVDAVRKLSQTVATVVDVERKAHNLDTQAPSEDSMGELVRTLQGSSLPIIEHDPEHATR